MAEYYGEASYQRKKAVTSQALGNADAIEEHFSIRFLNALIRSTLHIDPNALDDTEWALRAGEAFLMMEILAPNWNSKKE